MEERHVVDPRTQVELTVPPYSTPADVLAREELRRSGKLRKIRFFADWTVVWPLWESGNPIEPADIGIGAELAASLREWVDARERLVGPNQSGPAEAARERWERQGDDLAAHLQRELWMLAEVSVEHRR